MFALFLSAFEHFDNYGISSLRTRWAKRGLVFILKRAF
jgi:hypothetical protein